MCVAERNYPRDWTALLPVETARWAEKGIISDVQREAVLNLYPQPGAGARDRTILIFTILGSLLLGTGVILFFAANWPSIPAAVKVAVLLAAVLGAYGAGFYLQYVRDDYPRLGRSLIFLGSLLYGAAIWLLAQIFHLNTHYPQGFLLWGVGLLPLVLVTLSRPVLYLATTVLIIWTLTEQGSFGTYNFLFPVLALGALLPLARKARTALGEGLALLALFLWVLVAFANQVPGAGLAGNLVPAARVAVIYGALLMTIALAGLGEERTYLASGGFLTLAGTYVLTFRAMAARPDVGAAPPWLFAGSPFLTATATILLAAALAAGWVCWRRQPGNRLLLLPMLLAPVAASLGAGLLASVPQMAVFNILLFAGAIGLVTLGVQRRRELLVNLGLAAFIIHVLTRYFDLFFPAMNRSLFFILGGVLLLGGGWLLERNRRHWMRDWGGDGHDR